ncbi:hypothetical protein [Streptomyces sp. NPDC060366]|uniref:hypothetical protein n=1 Tax=Streptomyces sp. NPDC060366 TaxID=3347105 RepID=UPI00365E567F
MPKFSARPEVRIRQIPGDPRLHVTVGTDTISGRINGASITINAGDFPIVAVELDTGHPWGGAHWREPSVTLVEVEATRIYADDIANLTLDDGKLGDHQFAAAMRALADCLNTAPVPPCEHDSVVDVSTVGAPQAVGVCEQCGTSMVADYIRVETVGDWRPRT